MSSLLDHLDNSYSDGDEDDHINRLFPKCKPRASSLQPFTSSIASTGTSTTSTYNSSSSIDGHPPKTTKTGEKRFTESRTNSGLDFNLTNSNSNSHTNINSVNNNFQSRKRVVENHHQQQQQQFQHRHQDDTNPTTQLVIENGQVKDYNNFSFRCSNVTAGRHKAGNCENNSKSYKSKKGRGGGGGNSRHHRRHNRYNIEFVPTGESPCGRRPLISSSSLPTVHNQLSSGGGSVGGVGRKSTSTSYAKIMECDTLDDNFDNGPSSGSASTGSNGSAFSQCSSGSGGGDKNSSVSLGSALGGGTGGSRGDNVGLRDSRIEIAGGREIYSQNRIKAIRKAKQAAEFSTAGGGGGMGIHLTSSTPSSQSSQLQAKIRRKSSQNNTNPLLSPSSPVSSTCNNSGGGGGNIWEPHHLVAANKKSFPFSSSSSSSSRGGGDVERDNNSGRGVGAVTFTGNSTMTSRHGQSGGHSYLQSSGGGGGDRSNSHSQSRNFGRHGYDYSDARKTLSLDGFDMMGNKSMLPQVHSSAAGTAAALASSNNLLLTSPSSSSSTTSTTGAGGLMMKETVFASEITCIEKSVEVVGATAGVGAKEKQPFIYETPIDGGEIVFDDIEDQWGGGGGGRGGSRRKKEDDKEATFVSLGHHVDKAQLNFLETLMRDNDEQQLHHHQTQQQLQYQHHSHQQQHHHVQQQQQGQARKVSCSNPSGYESDECASTSPVPPSPLTTSSNSKTSPNNGNKRLIGNIPIAEYEGSPKRYGLRAPTQAKPNHLELVDPNSPTIAHLSVVSSATTITTNTSRVVSPRLSSPSSSSTSSSFQGGGGGGRVPGFPQRVDTTSNVIPSTPTTTSSNSVKTILVNDSAGSTETCSSSSVGMGSCSSAVTMERNHDHRSEPDGQLNAKLDRIMSTTGTSTTNNPGSGGPVSTSSPPSLPVTSTTDSSTGMGGGGVISRTMTTETTDTSPDDSLASQQGSNNTTTNSSEDPELLDAVPSHRPHLKEDRDDYLLYEFSETRKVLEEFFKPSSLSTGGGGGEDGRLTNFDELDYTLRRQTGNSYVGQRLAGESSNEQVEESPKKPPRRGVLLNVSSGGGASPKLISFQEVSLPPLSSSALNSHSQSSSMSPSASSIMMGMGGAPAMLLDSSRDVNDNDVDVETASTETDLGDTEVGLQVGHSRNFTLSPETTDCDSNELESEISLDYEASLHSSSRLGATMPVLEDGLSSGNVSDNEDRDEDEGGGGGGRERKRTGLTLNSCVKNMTGLGQNNNPSEPNPTLLLMKKQISEIEKEIKLRSQRVHHPSDAVATNGGANPCNLGGGNNGVTNGTGLSQPGGGGILPLSNNKGKHHHQMDMVNSAEDNFGVRDSSSRPESNIFDCNDPELEALDPMRPTPPPSPAPSSVPHHLHNSLHHLNSGQQQQQVSSQPPQLLTSRMVSFSTGRSGGDPSGVPNSNPPHSSTNSSNSHSCGGDSNSNNVGSCVTTVSSSCLTTTTTAGGTGTNTNSSLGLLADSTSTILSSDSPSASSGGGGLSSSTATTAIGTDIQGTKDAIQLPKSFPSLRSSFDSPPSTISSTTNTTNTTTNFLASSSSQQLPPQSSPSSEERLAPLVRDSSPVWVPRHPASGSHPHRSAGVRDPLFLRKQRYEETPDDDADTDQETDRLLGQNRTEDDYGFYDEKEWKKVKSRSILPSMSKGVVSSFKSASTPAAAAISAQLYNSTSTPTVGGGGCSASNSANLPSSHQKSLVFPPLSSSVQSGSPGHFKNSSISSSASISQIPNSTLSSASSVSSRSKKDGAKKKRSKEDLMNNPSVLIEGVLFRARYLGSTQLVCEGQPTKATRMMQAEEAVSRIKAQTSQNGSVCQLSSSPSAPSIETNKALGSANAITPYTLKTEGGGGGCGDFGVCEGGRHGQDQEYDDGGGGGGGESDEDSMDDDDDYRQQRNPVAAALGGSIVDNNIMALGENSLLAGSRLSSSDMTGGGLPPFGLTGGAGSLGGSLPHLSPPCGSALPGTMFRLRFVGSLEVEEEVGSGRRRRKRPKKTMVEEAVLKLKAPEGETQPSTEVDLFISTEKIMVLNTDLKEIMMDHALRTISYIADIGDLVVLMARRRPVPTDTVDESKIPRPPKMICHVFESDEAQYIAQSIGQAFQVAYMEFLKANGIEDHSFVREMDYQEVLNSQEIFGDELQMFAKKELQKEVVVPKTKGEILGVVIVESGWGSMLPTVVIANLAPAGAAARCGQLNIGDQIIAINGVSLVGLPLSTCQNYIKNAKAQTVVKLTVVPCPPVVEVKIKRPDTKYQLGFSVQNGVICSLLRGGIAERGGVRVGHRIIEINNQSVVAVPHEKIVNLLATSVGEINMKTMPTSMFRLLTGQESPLYI